MNTNTSHCECSLQKLSYLDQRLQELDKQQEQTEQQLEKERTILLKQLKDIQVNHKAFMAFFDIHLISKVRLSQLFWTYICTYSVHTAFSFLLVLTYEVHSLETG